MRPTYYYVDPTLLSKGRTLFWNVKLGPALSVTDRGARTLHESCARPPRAPSPCRSLCSPGLCHSRRAARNEYPPPDPPLGTRPEIINIRALRTSEINVHQQECRSLCTPDLCHSRTAVRSAPPDPPPRTRPENINIRALRTIEMKVH